jgi:hypothetical protein
MEALKSIVERFWNDVAGLPWRDKQWVNNPRLIEQTRQHYVNATYDDLSKLIEQPALKVVIKKLEALRHIARLLRLLVGKVRWKPTRSQGAMAQRHS